MKNNEKVLLALVTGLATGAVLGILMAPEKGTKTRRMITDQSKKVASDLFEKFNEGKTGFNNFRNEIVEAVKEVVCKEPAESKEKPVASYEQN